MSSSAKRSRLRALFETAMEKDLEDRLAFISDIRRADKTLADELTTLIRAYQDDARTLEHSFSQIEDLATTELPTFSDGELILNRFRIIRLLGLGGMGEVYEAHDLELGRVALKTIRQHIAGNPQMLLRFKREVQLARRVTSANVCRIHELFTLPASGDRPPLAFLTMEFLEGRTLADRLHQRDPLPWAEVKLIASQLCSGLQAIHDAGVIHRDLKSHNVMLTSRRGATHAVIMDLGISHDAGIEYGSPALRVTLPGVVAGTPGYIAPEQLEFGCLSPASDIYSLGIVLYEMGTGKTPFETANASAEPTLISKRIQSDYCVAPKAFRSHWAWVVEKCLAHNPQDRFESPTAVSRALEQSWPLDIRSFYPVSKKKARLLNGIAISLALLLLLSVAAGYFWYRTTYYYKPSPEAEQLYREGTAALRNGTYLKATRDLQKALELDKSFLMAHVRLAEAWSELDFKGEADEQMLWARPELIRRLSRPDKNYVEAVRATLVGDFPGALRFYNRVLAELPAGEKAFGYLNLGRTAEKQGHNAEAIQYYSYAIKLRKDLPSSFLRRGVLKALQGDQADADADFGKAEKQFLNSSNYEGIAELAYQRSYVANQLGMSTDAKRFADKSLEAARVIESVQLKSRALVEQSHTFFLQGGNDQAEKTAQEAVTLAQDNGLDYWAANGLILLGYADIGRSKFKEAESYLLRASQWAHRSRWPKLEADAQIGLATASNIQGKPDEVIRFAEPARAYYKESGFFYEYAGAEAQIIRAKIDKKDFEGALQAGRDLVALVGKHNNPLVALRAEEAMGSVFQNMERYPEALAHFKAALEADPYIDRLGQYDRLQCADALWKLGHFDKADEMIKSIPPSIRKQHQFASESTRVKANMLMSQGRFSESLRLASRALSEFSSMRLSMSVDFEITAAMSHLNLGHLKQAQNLSEDALKKAQQDRAPETMAFAELAQSAIQTAAGDPQRAVSLARAANKFFSEKQKRESEWISLLYLARALRKSGDSAGSRQAALEAQEVMSQIERAWGDATFKNYASRPDIARARRDLSTLTRI